MDKTENRINLVESSFTQLKADKLLFSEHFYKCLFEKSPQLRPLFTDTTIESQSKKLYAALVLFVENLRHNEELEKILLPLGKRHKGYGVIDEHYLVFSETLQDTLSFFLKSEWTPEVKEAWDATLENVIRTMLIGAGAKPLKIKKELNKSVEKNDNDNIQVELLQNSFEVIKPQKQEFAETFYSNLFVLSPELKPLFVNTDMKKQAGKLYGALMLLVENIRRPEALEKVLIPLGKKHKGYGTIDAHYPLVGAALMQTLESFLESEWTPEVNQSWEAAYQTAVDLMIQGYSSERAKRKNDKTAKTKTESSTKLNTVRKKVKLSASQISQRSSKNLLLTKMNNWFWETEKWKIALGVAIFFFLLIPAGHKVPAIQDILGILEPLSIVLALILFIRESPERKKQYLYQAWGIVDAANGIRSSNARITALQDLCDANVSLKGLDLSGAKLSGIELNGCDLSNTNLTNTALNNAELGSSDMNNADLSHSSCTDIILSNSNLGFASLHKANFSSADFSDANLMFANLTEGNFSGANLSNANLKGADFEGAYLSGANLEGAEVNLDEIEHAYLVKAIMPDGTVHE